VRKEASRSFAVQFTFTVITLDATSKATQRMQELRCVVACGVDEPYFMTYFYAAISTIASEML